MILLNEQSIFSRVYTLTSSFNGNTEPLDFANHRQIHRPPGVRRVTFRRIYDSSVLNEAGLCIFMSAYPPATASYTVRVTQAKSFAFTFLQTTLRSNALGVQLGVPVITASRGTCTLQVTSRFAFH